MKQNAQTAFEKLKAIQAPVFERSDVENFVLSAEENDDKVWASYWDAYIDEEVEQILADNGLWLEWETAGALIAYQI